MAKQYADQMLYTHIGNPLKFYKKVVKELTPAEVDDALEQLYSMLAKRKAGNGPTKSLEAYLEAFKKEVNHD